MAVFSWSPTSLAVVFIIVGVIAYLLARISLAFFAKQADRNPLTMPVAAFVGTITTAWALSLGFTAADIWSVNATASQMASAERSSMTRLAGMAAPEALNLTELQESLRDYYHAVNDVEWLQGANRTPEKLVEQALQRIRLSLIALSKTNVSDPILGQLVQDFDELQDARNSRLAIGESSGNHIKWYLVLFLTFLSAISVAAVHADREKAGRKAAALFAVTAGFSLWILALHVNPYVGVAQVTLGKVRF